MEYQILTEKSVVDLQDLVNKRIGDGWTPLGGVSVAVDGGSTYFVQAMTKEKEREEYYVAD
jgi:hypothetical protein